MKGPLDLSDSNPKNLLGSLHPLSLFDFLLLMLLTAKMFVDHKQSIIYKHFL